MCVEVGHTILGNVAVWRDSGMLGHYPEAVVFLLFSATLTWAFF